MIGIIIATAAMTGFVWPLRNMTPGLTALVTQATLGGLVYALVLIAFDVVGLRQLIGLRLGLLFKSKT